MTRRFFAPSIALALCLLQAGYAAESDSSSASKSNLDVAYTVVQDSISNTLSDITEIYNAHTSHPSELAAYLSPRDPYASQARAFLTSKDLAASPLLHADYQLGTIQIDDGLNHVQIGADEFINHFVSVNGRPFRWNFTLSYATNVSLLRSLLRTAAPLPHPAAPARHAFLDFLAEPSAWADLPPQQPAATQNTTAIMKSTVVLSLTLNSKANATDEINAVEESVKAALSKCQPVSSERSNPPTGSGFGAFFSSASSAASRLWTDTKDAVRGQNSTATAEFDLSKILAKDAPTSDSDRATAVLKILEREKGMSVTVDTHTQNNKSSRKAVQIVDPISKNTTALRQWSNALGGNESNASFSSVAAGHKDQADVALSQNRAALSKLFGDFKTLHQCQADQPPSTVADNSVDDGKTPAAQTVDQIPSNGKDDPWSNAGYVGNLSQ